MLKVKLKKLHPDAIIPSYSKPGDAGLDLTAVDVEYDEKSDCIIYKTGISVEIPEGYVGLLFCRSSIFKKPIYLTNSTGVIDSGYRGEVMLKFKAINDYWDAAVNYSLFHNDLRDGEFKFYYTAESEYNEIRHIIDVYKVGDRVAQLVIIPYPKIEFEEVTELSVSERGENGYGSTGR